MRLLINGSCDANCSWIGEVMTLLMDHVMLTVVGLEKS